MSARSRTPLVIAVVLAVVAVVAIAAVALSGGSDDEDAASTVPPTSTSASELGEAMVEVDGEPLTPLPEEGADPAVGTAAPALSGFDYSGDPVDITPGSGGPMMVVFLAHWCPHCNDEVPVLQQWQADGGIPDDLQVVGVSTAARPDAPNYPPGEWLAEKGWDWPVLADDASSTAAQAYGLTYFPFLTFIDADGNVEARAYGELPIEELQLLADATVA